MIRNEALKAYAAQYGPLTIEYRGRYLQPSVGLGHAAMAMGRSVLNYVEL